MLVYRKITQKANLRDHIQTIQYGKYQTRVSVTEQFLYEAIFISEGIEAPPKSIIKSPELQVYVEHFGESKDDCGLMTEVDGKIVGA